MTENNFVKEQIINIMSDKDDFSDVFLIYGEINLSIIASCIVIIENKLKSQNYSKSLISRVKLISIELLDNIYKHQLIDANYKPFFQVLISKSKVKFNSGNCINQQNYEVLNKKLSSLSDLNPNEVQNLYMNKLKNNKLDGDGNAGLGLLSIMKKGGVSYNYDLIKLPNNNYFYKNSINLINN